MKLRQHEPFTRLLRSRPLMLAALLYLAGCILGHHLELPMVYAGCGLPVLLAASACCFKYKRRFAAAFLVLAFIPFGMLRFSMVWKKTEPLQDQKNAILSGRIAQTPVWNADTERCICVLEDLYIDDAAADGRLRLYLRGDIQLLQAVQLGQRVNCEAHIWRADEATNPGQFDFSEFLRLNGLRGYATAEIESADFTEPEYHPADMPERLRARITLRIDRLFPENAHLARAFLLGDRSGLSEEERESYSISGAAHLLAISGMHVSMLAGAVSFLLSLFMNRRRAFLITLMLLAAYGGLLGFSASLFRAILMFAVFGSAPLFGRYSDSPTRLSAAMLLYLLIDPCAVLESGFILSYLATAGIILLYHPLQRLFGVAAFTSKRTDVNVLGFLTRRLPSLVLQSLLLTLAAQIAILPAVIHFFGAQPVWSFAVNLLAVPLAMLAYGAAIAGTISGIVPIALLSDWLFGRLTALVSFFSDLPFASICIARFPVWLLLICAALMFCASDLSRIPEKLRQFLPLAIVPAILLSNFSANLSLRGCSVVFMDAGEADCSVLRCEGKVYLVDTGDSYTPAADYLSAMNFTPDGIFLTHPHADHAGGLEKILDVCTPERIYVSANWDLVDSDEGMDELLQRAVAQGAQLERISAGDTIVLSGKTLLEVLSPSAGFPANSANDDSLVLRLRYGECTAVFTGDAPAAVTTGKLGDADILKVAHHGSDDSLNAAMLEELSPSLAIIPVGYNSYGHPAADTLKRLAAADTKVYRSDLHGAVFCKLNEDGSVQVRTHHASEDVNGLE